MSDFLERIDDMDIEKKLKQYIEETPVPDSISPANMAKMLERKKANQKKSLPEESPAMKPSFAIGYRVTAAIAACIVMVFGVMTYYGGSGANLNSPIDDVETANDYSEVYEKIVSLYNDSFYSAKGDTEAIAEGDMVTDESSNNNDFSRTNVQVEGVDEADIIKTDGEYIYYIAREKLHIVSAAKGNMELASVTGRKDIIPVEMYLAENKLIVVSTVRGIASNEQADSPIGSPDIWIDDAFYANDTIIEIFDIADKKNPTLITSYEQKGAYNTSRMIQDNLYLITSYQNYDKPENEDDYESYVPSYKVDDEKHFVSASDICIPGKIDSPNYAICAGLDINSSEPLISIKATLGYSGDVYASSDNIYLTTPVYTSNQYRTTIIKFSLDNGNIDKEINATVPGNIVNQFSMDEYNDTFRIATTSYSQKESATVTNLFILDMDLNEIGSLTDLAKGEQIYSVRFDGDTAYIVTFYQTDPLFTIDLSAPTSPTVKDELKITGFSTYMHRWEDNLLLGFGQEATEDGIVTGLKLSMFDVSDESNAVEADKVMLNPEGNFDYSEALYNHKAILIDDEKNLIGLPSSYFDGISTISQYFVYGYNDDDGFFLKGKLDYHDVKDEYFTGFERGLFIDDVLYIASQSRIVAATIDEVKVISTIDIN